jgi:iron complex transport system substrate-binding protein
MGYMRRVSLFVSLICLISLFGCKNQEGVVGGKIHEPQSHTVISLSPSTTELVSLYGMNYQLIGRTRSCNYPTTIEKVPIVADVKPDYEKIAGLKPGLIVYDAGLYSPADVQKLNQTGTSLVEIKGDTIDQFVESLYGLGKALHAETQISEYIDTILQTRASAMADPLPPSIKVAILLSSQTGGMVAGMDSFQADALRAAGATPVGPPGKMFMTMSPESFVEMNPDMVVLATTKAAGPRAVDGLLSDPRFKSVKAIRNRKILVLDEDVVLRRGQRVDKLIDAMHRRLKAQI